MDLADGPWNDYQPQQVAVSATRPAADGPWSDYAPQQTGQDALGGHLLPPDAQGQPRPNASEGGFWQGASDYTTGVAHRLDQATDLAANAFTLGIGHPVGAAVTAAMGGDGSFMDRYHAARAAQDAVTADVPLAPRIATELVGGVASPIAAGVARGVGAAYDAFPGVNALASAGRVGAGTNALLRAGTEGAAVGAAQAVPETSGDASNRLAQIGDAAATGAILAPSTNVLFGGMGKLGDILSEAGVGRRNALLPNTPAVTPGVANVAGRQLASAASDPVAVQAATAQPGVLVPGSQPTTFQQTGDTGLGQLERRLRTGQGTSQSFIDRANEQNAARVQAITDAAPANAASSDLTDTLVARRDSLANRSASTQQQAQQAGNDLATALGGNVAGDATTAQQQFGQRFRAVLDGNNQTAKEGEGALWQAIDPDRSLASDATAVRQSAREITDSHGAYAAPMTADEARIIGLAREMPDAIPFQDLAEFRSQLMDAVRTARVNGEGQTVRRLSQLLDGVHDSLEGAATGKVAQEAAAVQAGQMSPEQAILARINDWASRQQQAAGEAASAGVGDRAVPVALTGTGPAADVGPFRAASQTGGGAGYPPGNSGVSQGAQPLVPNFDAKAAARYSAARQATAERHATYTNAPGVGPALAPGPTKGTFALLDSSVPQAIFSNGAGAGERVQAAIKAGLSPQQIGDYAAFDARRAATRPDGTLDPAKLDRWRARNGEAFQALSQADPAIARRFDSAATAQSALDDAVARQAEAVKAYQSSVARGFLNGASPAEGVGAILNKPTALPQMQQLAKLTENDPDARAGLQRAIVEHIQAKFGGNAMAGQTGTTTLSSNALQTFLKRNASALRAVMAPQQVDALGKVALDLQRSALSNAGTRAAVGSDTMQNAALHGGAARTVLSMLGEGPAESIGAVAGFLTGGVVGSLGLAKVGSVADKLVAKFRAAGIRQASDLVTEAMLNPALANVLLARVNDQTRPNVLKALGVVLGRAASGNAGSFAATRN